MVGSGALGNISHGPDTKYTFVTGIAAEDSESRRVLSAIAAIIDCLTLTWIAAAAARIGPRVLKLCVGGGGQEQRSDSVAMLAQSWRKRFG